MTRDPEVLGHILNGTLIVAAFFATLFPILYSFSPWYRTWLGRVLMLHGVALALALLVTLAFRYWPIQDILVIFWIELLVFGLIGTASFLMCYMLLRNNYIKRSKNESA